MRVLVGRRQAGDDGGCGDVVGEERDAWPPTPTAGRRMEANGEESHAAVWLCLILRPSSPPPRSLRSSLARCACQSTALSIATIDSRTPSNPPRVSTPHQTPILEPDQSSLRSAFAFVPLNTSSSTSRNPQQPSTASTVPHTRTRSELEEGDADARSAEYAPASTSLSSVPLSYLHPSSSGFLSSPPTPPSLDADPELVRARKRQRVDSRTTSPSSSLASIERALILADSATVSASSSLVPSERTAMRLTESDRDSALSVSLDSNPEAGPSSSAAGPSNGHKATVAKSNGFSQPYTNGSSNGLSKYGSSEQLDGHSHTPEKHKPPVSRVTLPGRTLYDDSFVDREEFVRLVIQGLRDVGYMESATTLEAESGYIMETPEVAEFRRCILNASWDSAEAALMRLGVSEDDGLWEAKFLIAKQKYLEYLEAGKTTAALHVLRNELAPLNPELEHLHALSALMMCSDPADLRQQVGWDGAGGVSRRRLLMDLQRYIPSSVMIPQRRIATLLEQARAYQQSRCLYHNVGPKNRSYSLYTDHCCDRNAFPRVTTAVLKVHSDEVWNLEWSHSGRYLATASKDKSAIIWRVELDKDARSRAYSPEFVLRDHPYPVGCVAWSLDDSILLTAAEHFIRLWNTRTGECTRVLDQHSDVVTALAWLPDGSGFISGGLDRKIILWDADGKLRDVWGRTPIRVTDLMVTPDFTRLVAVGMYDAPPVQPGSNAQDGGTPPGSGQGQGAAAGANKSTSETRIIIYDLHTKQPETSIRLDGELTSVKISQDSQFALINRASENGPPAEIHLLDLASEQVVRKYSGHSQSKHVIRSCFGGVEGNFIVSGSEDGNVYIWHRDTGALLEVLVGHGDGSVNSVAWNPVNERMFASCSDDKTIRIWEAPPPDPHPHSDVAHAADVPHEEEHEMENGKGKGKGRWDAGGSGSGSSTSVAAGHGIDPESGPGYGLGSTTALF